MIDLSLDHISYLGIIVVLILTGCGLPLPEEVPIVAAGIASSLGSLHPGLAFAACMVGALVGDSIIYFIGYRFGHSLMVRHPRLAFLLHAEREARIEQMIRKHEFKVFFLSRFMVGVRAPVFLTAGILRIPFRRFLLIDTFCATVVVGLFFGLSYAYGDHLTHWIRRSEMGLTVIVAIAAAVALGVYFWKRARSKSDATIERLDRQREECAVGADPPSGIAPEQRRRA